MLDIILLASIAAFVLLKLFSILGRHDTRKDREKGIFELIDKVEKDASFKRKNKSTVSSSEKNLPQSEQNIIKKLRTYEPNFNLDNYLKTTEKVFEVVVSSICAQDKDTLKELISKDLNKAFITEIDRRKKAGEKHEIAIVKIRSYPEKIAMREKNLDITVLFATEQIYTVYDKNNKIIEGDKEHIQETKEKWTFTRDIEKAYNPWLVNVIKAS